MNYTIIADEQKLRDFIDWLPVCDINEQFYCCLFMRKKYCPLVPWIKSDKGQLKRFTSTKEKMFDKIAQLEVKVGAYKFDGTDVPQESLALYVSPNPRDLWKATVRSIGQLAKVLECNGRNSNPHQEVMSEIQRSSGNRKYIAFDIDEKNDDLLQECIGYCDGYCDVTETRGGYHLFVHKEHVDKITNKRWHPSIGKYADQSGELMTPPWGTLQGMWEVTPIYRMIQNPSLEIETLPS